MPRRLHDLVTEKLAEAQRRIDELAAFRDQPDPMFHATPLQWADFLKQPAVSGSSPTTRRGQVR